MKIRTSFVTNSSSSNFVIFGNSKENIIRTIREQEIFGPISDDVANRLEEEEPIRGIDLFNFYDDYIKTKLYEARNRALQALRKKDIVDWMLDGDICQNGISRPAFFLSDFYLNENVAFKIELGDYIGVSERERLGWKATGYHYVDKKVTDDSMIIIIGINGH